MNRDRRADYEKSDNKRTDNRRSDNRKSDKDRFDNRKSDYQNADRKKHRERHDRSKDSFNKARFNRESDADNINSYAGNAEDAYVNPLMLEGRNAVLEALRAGRDIDRIMILDGAHDNALGSIIREAKNHRETKLEFVEKKRLDELSSSGKHQGVIAFQAAYNYAEVEDILKKAEEKGEPPFVFILDGIEDPHNLGAIIRTANLCGAHGVIIRLNRAVGLTATVAKASAGAINYTPVAKVTNIGSTIDELKKRGMWFVCADMGGESMYKLNLKGSIGLVIGNEGKGVSELVKKKCDMIASIPMFGDIDSLNASVATGVLAYEIVRQRLS